MKSKNNKKLSYRLETGRQQCILLYYQTLESLPKICAADSMCLSLLVFTQFPNSHGLSQPKKPARKQNLTPNSQSRSFKVTHFGITKKPTTDCMLPYNNAGLISKVSEKIVSENAKNCRCRQPHWRLTPLPRVPPWIFAQILYRQKLKILAYISAADSVGLSSLKFLWWAPKDASFPQQSAYRPFKGHPRSLTLAPIERAYATSY